jgi:tetratricopeptide (TPR) repeat protein
LCLLHAPAEDSAAIEWLLEVLRAVDSGPWRDDVRRALAERNTDDLRRLAADADVAAHPTSLLMSLVHRLVASECEADGLSLLTRLHAVRPSDFWVNTNCGMALQQLNRSELTARYFQAALALRPENAGAWLNYGRALHQSNDTHGAIGAYRRAIALEPDYAAAHNNLGNLLFAQKKFSEAEACYRRAIELVPTFAWTHNNLGYLLHGQEKPAEAEACYRRAIELEPTFATAHVNLGNLLHKQMKPAEAVASYRRAIELDPTDAEPHNSLAWFLSTYPDVNHRDPASAVELAQKAVELAPDAGHMWNSLGVAQYRDGQWKAAMESLKKSMQLRGGGDSGDYFFLAMTHWQLGAQEESSAEGRRRHQNEAHKWYERATDWMDKNLPDDEELVRFRAEATELIGIKQTPTQISQQDDDPEKTANSGRKGP